MAVQIIEIINIRFMRSVAGSSVRSIDGNSLMENLVEVKSQQVTFKCRENERNLHLILMAMVYHKIIWLIFLLIMWVANKMNIYAEINCIYCQVILGI